MTMIEKVARAIAAVDGIEDWKSFLSEARAAIEAMREPDEYMLAAAEQRLDEGRIVGRLIWQVMIDAILADGNITDDT